ncbi:MAG: YkgJ family cysteine cluster protein [Desulfovibrionaceae bacterium]|nr:YkgJ family cysteine cluster protein [Desulfovibrionaceae bacterium]MBF0513177.1 YkgJ family cysteine cluster protein [Desulfovibrionaceae bacterium]
MDLDLSAIFSEYEKMAAEADALFATVKKACPEQVSCREGCSDCCHALFDLSLVEAMYINAKFAELVSGEDDRESVIALAGESDRAHYRLKRQAFKASQEGVPAAEILDIIARERIRCPLLDDTDHCRLYEHRPITCRIYGAPMEIGGKAHTCAKTGFTPGEKYPTVKVELIQDRLIALSQKIVDAIPTKHAALASVLVPVSMALLSTYDEEYLGLPTEPSEDDAAQAEMPASCGCGDPTRGCGADNPGASPECKNCDSLFIREIGGTGGTGGLGGEQPGDASSAGAAKS